VIIYLDQNKWIDLARAISEPQQYPNYVEVAEKIKKKVREEEWIFPVSIIHIMETMARADDNSRRKLASTISSFTKNHSIKSSIDIEPCEFIELFSKQLNKEKSLEFKPIEQNLLQAISVSSVNVGFTKTIISPEVDNEIKNILEKHFNHKLLEDKSLFSILMESCYDKEANEEMVKEDIESVKQWEKLQKYLEKLPKKHKYERCLAETFSAKLIHHASLIKKTLNITSEELLQPLKTNDIKEKVQFMESIPTLNVEVNLMYELLKNPQRKVQSHDNRDIAFLSAAIPYCDIVITERTWVHSSKTRRLDSKYSTVIDSDLNILLSK